jgi:hypothetical protein
MVMKSTPAQSNIRNIVSGIMGMRPKYNDKIKNGRQFKWVPKCTNFGSGKYEFKPSSTDMASLAVKVSEALQSHEHVVVKFYSNGREWIDHASCELTVKVLDG